MNCIADAPGCKSRVQGAFRLLSYYIKSERGSLVCSRMARDSTPRFVGPSIRPSVHSSVRLPVHPYVRPSHFTFLALMGVLALLLLLKCSIDLNYGPCPPARDWGSRVSGLVRSSFYLPASTYESNEETRRLSVVSNLR